VLVLVLVRGAVLLALPCTLMGAEKAPNVNSELSEERLRSVGWDVATAGILDSPEPPPLPPPEEALLPDLASTLSPRSDFLVLSRLASFFAVIGEDLSPLSTVISAGLLPLAFLFAALAQAPPFTTGAGMSEASPLPALGPAGKSLSVKAFCLAAR